VILRSNPEHEVPDLVMDLRGIIDVNVVGVIDAIHGQNRTTFEGIPDQPVSKFELTLQGGGKGLLVNSKSLCGHHPRAQALIDGQNGLTADQRPEMKADCGAAKHKKHKRHRRIRHKRRHGHRAGKAGAR
jgi:hypothetical protein